ncbi:MAG: cohesin domain-containing protein, partial [Candidatus Poribacteria bacterium]|nr:cohesin domain-containing protein [Candidatus Poribacteria bacterium]
LYLVGNGISNVSPLAGLTGLTRLELRDNHILDISPLAGLTNLEWLNLLTNDISDISPVAGLYSLKWLSLHNNKISDISALAGLTNLTWLDVAKNEIADLSPLNGLRGNAIFLVSYYNPGFPQGGAKIEGPWLWVFLPGTQLEGTDLLSEASEGTVTEIAVATEGATVGKSVGDEVWISDRLPPTGRDNLDDMLGRDLPNGVMYGTVSLYSPREQDTTMYLGSDQEVRVWLNGRVVYNRQAIHNGGDYTDFFPVTLKRGNNVLLVAVATRDDAPHGGHSNAFVGFEAGAEYAVATGISYAFSETPIHIGDTFTVDIRAENVSDLAGWQFDVDFDSSVLEAIDVSEGDFLKTDGGTTFFQSGIIDNAAGKITGLIAGRISEGGVSGSGSVLQVRFKAKSEGETELALQNFLFGSAAKESIPAAPLEIHITVEERLLTGDVNRDGVVNILDLISVAQQLGKRVSSDSPEDINGDGVINIFDLTLVAQGIGGAAAPAVATDSVEAAMVEAWIAEARLADDGSIAFRQGIANLQNLLAALVVPQETALHANYPNPFNPETWIPYQLAVPAEATLTIYDMNGGVVRRLKMGYQAAGMYQSRSRALYWDGRNERGESVASGLYFYTLRAGGFTGTRKMLIRK